MTELAAASADNDVDVRRAKWARYWVVFRRQRAAMVALIGLVLVLIVAIAGPWLAPYSPDQNNLTDLLKGPSRAHWLGTDDLGRDVLSRLIYASRVSLLASAQAVLFAVGIGVFVGLLSGYLGGIVDALVMRITDSILILPGLLLVMTIVGILGPGLTQAMVGLGVAFSPVFVRLTRAETLACREMPFVEAARAGGSGAARIIRKHIFPNIVTPLIIQVMMVMGFALLAEGALSYLGLSVQPPTASWGVMLSRAYAFSSTQPWAVLVPGGAIAMCVWAFNALGDGLRDALSPDQGESR